MKNAGRQLISFILPGTVLILIPLYLEPDISINNVITPIIGLVIICVGLYIIVNTISLFIRVGKVTLAPYSPTKKLVVKGMYRYIRNPMIVGVLIVLIGESITILSLKIFLWAVAFFIINTVYFLFYEEPDLEKKFGEEYRQYKQQVARWLPRLTPYRPNNENEK